MDREAYKNMTYSGRNQNNYEQSFNNCTACLILKENNVGKLCNKHTKQNQENSSRPVGGAVSKVNVNNRMTNYYLERQSKNNDNYNGYLNALNQNISEDQYRTQINNEHVTQDVIKQNQIADDQRIFHPSLLTADPRQSQGFTELDRQSVDTRRQRMNGILARNRHTGASVATMHSAPRLNYPYGRPDETPIPLNMDLSSQLEQQFKGLTTPDLDQQIQRLQQQNAPNQTNSTSGNGFNLNNMWNVWNQQIP